MEINLEINLEINFSLEKIIKYFGKKIRTVFPKGKTLIEFLRKRFGKNLFKLILLMTIFYMFIFLCAEITAVAMVILAESPSTP